MKQLTKKIVAVICVVAMLVGVIVPNGLTLNTKAADTATQSTEATDSTAREWWVYGDDDADTGLVLTGSGSRKSISDAGVNLPEGLIEANLSLQIKLNVSATADVISALNSVNAVTFELANEMNDAGELSWNCGSLQSGENNLTFSFKNAAHTNGSAVNGTAVQDGKSPFDWEETIDFFGLYLEGYSTDATALSITVESVKIVYTDAGLTFGADDTYLQLDSAMNATPNAVEATVNMDEMDTRTKWTLRPGSDTSTFYVASGHGLTTGVTTADDEPGAGMTYSVLDASTTAVTGFNAFNADLGIDASQYTKEQLAIGFWIYAETAGTLSPWDSGQLRLGSNTGTEFSAIDTNCLFYYGHSIELNAGWNYKELLLSDWQTAIAGDFSLESINSFGFYQTTVSEGQKLYFGDFKLIVIESETDSEETEDNALATLRSGSDTSTFYVASGHGLTTGVTTAGEAPGEGMTYSILDASTTAVSRFNAFNANLGINASQYTKEQLAVGFWIYAEKEGTLSPWDSGQLRLGSNTGTDFSAIDTNCLFYYGHEIELASGWNYKEILLSNWKTDIAGSFSLESINSFGFYQTSVSQGQKLYFGDFKLVLVEDKNAEKVVDEGDIVVTKNISSVANNYMIFSNVNSAGESNPFAMYVTPDGYLGVLYGTTQFVLNQSVDTGADVKVKVAINASGQVEFYIDGSLVATSQTTVSSLGAPITPYNIGADGVGAQTFVGTIKDVKTYSDAAAITCTGHWPLIGDVRYVVETMPDVSGNGNNATFKGTRANDWYDVETIGEDDWSLVFIPDIVQRFYAGEHATWHKMAKWIGANVEEENIKYVIGAKTADSAQADAMNYGYEFFDTAVPTTNLNNSAFGYYRFQVNGVKWMVMTLANELTSETFASAKEVLAQYPYDNVIVTCNEYYDGIWGELGQYNVKLILCGTQGGEPSADAPVMIFPAQNDLENSYFGEQGLGLLYMLRFTDGGTKVTARSYAPIYDSYFTGVVNYEKTIDTKQAPDVLIKEYAGATPGVAPTDVPKGMLFAGWFTKGVEKQVTIHSGYYFEDGVSAATRTQYTTTSSDAETGPKEGMDCFVLDHNGTLTNRFEANEFNLGIDVSEYTLDELALGFWVKSNATGKLGYFDTENGVDPQIRLKDGSGDDFLYYYMTEEDVHEGWQYITIPLDTFNQFPVSDTKLERIDSINTWQICSYTVPEGMELTFGDFELIAYGAGSSKEDALTAATTGTAYARFVDKDLLTVKAQIRANTSDQSNYSDIRFVTSVDRLEYKRMGFEISYERDNGSIKEIKGGATENNIVYQKLYVVGADGGEPEGYTPKEIIAASSVYFKAYTITNVPNRAFDRDFNVRAYWVTMDGTKVYGDYVDKSVWMGYQTNKEFLPVIVNTTYETDDVVIADVVLNDPKYGYVTAADVKNADYDWSTALQNALTDVHNKGGGTVYVPAGQYKLTKSITIPSDVTLRGDWQDPDVGTAYGTVFKIYPTQEITAYRNVDASHNQNTAAFVMTGSSGVVGITAYYPNQSIADGSAVPYPYTFYVTVGNDGGQLITLKNITVINGYRGIGTRYEMQHEALIVDNFKGTFLDCGMAIYNSSDTGTISNVSISSKYWKECSLGAVDASAYVLANATAIELGDLEWHQLSNCAIAGYNVGVSVVPGYRTNFSGSMIDMSITGCVTGITIADEINEKYYGNLNIKEVGDADTPDKQEYPLVKALDPRWGLVIARSTISATGNAIENYSEATTTTVLGSTTKVNQTPGLVRLTDVEVDEDKIVKKAYTKNNVFDSTSYNVQSSSEDLGTVVDATAQYHATYTITDAQKKNLWVVEGIKQYDGANVDVSELINAAMDKALERNANGGIVYIPGGTYRLDNPITVPAGVELHGASSVANREQYTDGEGTLFMVYYGDDDSNTATDTALVTLAGNNSGVSGVRFLYPENISTNTEEASDQQFYSTYTIAANGASNVHVTNCFIATSSYGVDLKNCDDFHVENLFTCVYRNTINVADSTGIIRGAWTNPNAIARTTAKGLTDNWPEEAVYNNSTAPINIIRNYLKDNLTFIQVSGSISDVLVHNITAYAHNKTVSQSGGNVLVINSNADSLDHENGVQFTLSGGTMKAINALRAAITDTGSSQDAATSFLYSHTGGTLSIYNSMMAKSTEKNSAWEDNYNVTK